MTIQTIGVVGAGTMGNGIAQVCAASGFDVVMLDISAEALARGLKSIDGSLDRLVKKEKMTADDKAKALARIRTETTLSDFKNVDFAIEAATENLALKIKLLKELDGAVRPEVIIATNTSSISITELAAATSRPSQVLGMHFFNPVPLMALVELIRGLQTSDVTLKTTQAFTQSLGKTPIVVKNSPGFVVNRILCPMVNEAIFVLQEGLATAEDIDNAMKLGCSHPIGPLALADMVGLDVMLSVMNVFYDGFKDPKYRPAPLLREMVAAGQLGRKSGQGFYRYTG